MPQPVKIGKKTRQSYSKIHEVAPVPNLIKIQKTHMIGSLKKV